MSKTVTLRGSVKFSLKKILTGAELASSEYKGPGEVVFAPPFLGDITTLRLTGPEDKWRVGKDAVIAHTSGVTKDTERQGLSKAVYSGEGLYIYTIFGSGVAWITSFGAIVQKEARLLDVYLFRYPLTCSSSNLASNILLTMVILWHGIVNTT